MEHIDFNQFVGVAEIHDCGDFIVILGAKVWILNRDGSLRLTIHDIPNATGFAILSNERFLICGGLDTSFRLISLKNGEEIWRIPQIKRLSFFRFRLVVSSDEQYAFTTYVYRNDYYLVMIHLTSGDMTCKKVEGGFRTLVDIACDTQQGVLFLKRQFDEIGEKRVGRNQVRRYNPETQRDDLIEYIWSSEAPNIAMCFLENTNSIMMYDLTLLNSQTGEQYNILENEPSDYTPYFRLSQCWLDHARKYIFLKDNTANLVVDWQKRKIVARYAVQFAKGCLIGDEYWVPTKNGILKKPFPIFEEIPPQKLFSW